MLKIRHEIWETNSSSCDEFYHKIVYANGKISFTVKLLADEIDDEQQKELIDVLKGWANNKGYMKDITILKCTKTLNEDALAVQIEASGDIYMSLDIVEREYYKTSWGKEPNDYWIEKYEAVLNEDCKNDTVLDGLVEYAQENSLMIPIIDISVDEVICEEKYPSRFI